MLNSRSALVCVLLPAGLLVGATAMAGERDHAKAARDAATLQGATQREAQLQAQLKADEAASVEQAKARIAQDRYWEQEGQAKLAKLNRQAEADEREAQRQDKVRRKVCGADYAKPAIGMHIERLRSCVGDLTLVSQVNRADGVASVYSAGRLQLVVIGGKVAAWQRH